MDAAGDPLDAPGDPSDAAGDPFDAAGDPFDAAAGLPLSGVVLPVTRLHPVAELARAAAEAPTVERLVKLVEWLGEGRDVGPTRALDPDDAKQAVADLALPEPEPGPGPEPTDTRDHIGLNGLWEIALELGWIDTDVQAVPGPTYLQWRDGGATARIQAWADIFVVVFDEGWNLGSRPTPDDELLEETGADVLAELLSRLYVTPQVDWRDVVQEYLDDVMVPALVPAWIETQLDHLADIGTLARDGDLARITPLGSYGINRHLVSNGARAAMVDPAAVTAMDLLLREDLQDPTTLDVAAEWVAARDQAEAADEVLTAAAMADTPLARVAAMHLLNHYLTDAGTAAFDDWLGHPRLGPYLRVRLDETTLAAADGIYLSVDGVAALVTLVEPPVRSDDLPPESWAMAEILLGAPAIWEHEHPDLLHVLDAVATGHPNRRVRDLAAEAAGKARSRRAS